MEGVHFIWTRQETTLSPQMLLECDPLDNDCAGGNMLTGFQYAAGEGSMSKREPGGGVKWGLDILLGCLPAFRWICPPHCFT